MISDELDKIQARLHDDGTLWSRTELLRWFNDGVRCLLAQSLATRRFAHLDIPGRTAWSGSNEWEDRHAKGTFRRFTRPSLSDNRQATYMWEVEALEGITPTNSGDCPTHLWERAFSNDIDQHFRFYLPKGHDRILRVAWDDRRLIGTSARELDLLQTKWWRQGGEPLHWLPGVGRDQTLEVYEVVTDYHQQYHHQEFDQGIPRQVSGDRSYTTQSDIYRNDYAYTGNGDVGGYVSGLGWRFTTTVDVDDTSTDEATFSDSDSAGSDTWAFTYWWEAELIPENYTTFAVGVSRYWHSPDRQYALAAYDGSYGSPRQFASSNDSISVLEAIVPTRDLTEDEDGTQLLHPRLMKYARYYTFAQAYNKEGEGKHPNLAAHYTLRFEMGVSFLKRIMTNINKREKVFARDDFTPVEAIPPRVRLPSTFERYW